MSNLLPKIRHSRIHVRPYVVGVVVHQYTAAAKIVIGIIYTAFFGSASNCFI